MDEALFGQDDEDEYNESIVTENQTSVDNIDLPIINQTNKDLFGDDDDDDDDVNNVRQHDGDDDNDDEDIDKDLFGDNNDNTMDLDNVEKIVETIHYGLCIPPNDAKRITDSSNNLFLRTPNSLEILPNTFDIKTYDSLNEQQTVGSVVTTLIRWRYKLDNDGNIVNDANGKPIRESNTRLVRLTDGGYKLVVGNIIFNVNIQQRDHSYVVSQQKSISQEDEEHFQDVSCLECIGQLEEEIRVIPTSLNSESHKRVSAKIKTTNSKKKLTNERDSNFSIVLNPQVEQDQRAKLEEEQLRKERKIKEKQIDNSYASNTLRRPSMSASYIQENDDLHDDINLSDIKRSSRQKLLKRKSNFSDDEDDEGEDVDNSDDDDEDDDDEDNGEMDDFIVKDDEEDNDEEYQESRISSKTDHNDDVDNGDGMDLMKHQRNKRRKNIVDSDEED